MFKKKRIKNNQHDEDCFVALFSKRNFHLFVLFFGKRRKMKIAKHIKLSHGKYFFENNKI